MKTNTVRLVAGFALAIGFVSSSCQPIEADASDVPMDKVVQGGCVTDNGCIAGQTCEGESVTSAGVCTPIEGASDAGLPAPGTPPAEAAPTPADNGCGGPLATAALPSLGANCGTCGRWVCDGPNGVRCQDMGLNQCGGCNILPYRLTGTCNVGGQAGNWYCVVGGNGLYCKVPVPGEPPPPPPPVDLCVNIAGVQSSVPVGLVRDAVGNCVSSTPPPTATPPERCDRADNDGDGQTDEGCLRMTCMWAGLCLAVRLDGNTSAHWHAYGDGGSPLLLPPLFVGPASDSYHWADQWSPAAGTEARSFGDSVTLQFCGASPNQAIVPRTCDVQPVSGTPCHEVGYPIVEAWLFDGCYLRAGSIWAPDR